MLARKMRIALRTAPDREADTTHQIVFIWSDRALARRTTSRKENLSPGPLPLTLNGLTACDGVIIPMQCEYYALEGLSALMSTIEQVRAVLNPRLQIEGILRTMYDPRSSLTKDVSEQLNEYFGDKVYRTCVPRNIRLAEAPSYGLPALAYDKQSKGAQAYLALAGEFIRRNDAAQKAALKAAS